MNNPRYQGKPLLRLLECYVLKAIDKLPTSEEETLIAMQPKLAQVYGVEGGWDHIIRIVMEWPSTMPTLIRTTWGKNQGIAANNGVVLSAQRFAEMFVDQNFSG